MTLGGVSVTCDEAACAVARLNATGASAIRSILSAAGNPLGRCDYWAVCRPYMDAARQALSPTGGIGPRGRHLAKHAFALAVHDALSRARQAELDAAVTALATDERYAAAIAADAVALRQRAHAAVLRARVRAAVTAAVARCDGPGSAGRTCGLTAACGTGQCPFAPEFLRGACAVPAPDGKLARPGCHLGPAGFSDSAAVAWLAEAEPWRAGVDVSDGDCSLSQDDIAA